MQARKRSGKSGKKSPRKSAKKKPLKTKAKPAAKVKRAAKPTPKPIKRPAPKRAVKPAPKRAVKPAKRPAPKPAIKRPAKLSARQLAARRRELAARRLHKRRREAALKGWETRHKKERAKERTRRKAAKTRKLSRKAKEDGARFLGQRVTTTFNYRYRDYEVKQIDEETIRDLIELEKARLPDGVRGLAGGTIGFIDRDGNKRFRGIKPRPLDPESSDEIMNQLEGLADQYEVEIESFTLTFTQARDDRSKGATGAQQMLPFSKPKPAPKKRKKRR